MVRQSQIKYCLLRVSPDGPLVTSYGMFLRKRLPPAFNLWRYLLLGRNWRNLDLFLVEIAFVGFELHHPPAQEGTISANGTPFVGIQTGLPRC